jgi:carboxyl-terminal processing protease
MKRQWLLIPLIALGLTGCKAAKPVEPPRASFDDDARAKFVASFDQVWTTIDERHWDPDKVGPAWDAARDELRPKVEQASSPAEARAVMMDLINRLGQTHFGIIPGSAYADLEAAEGERTSTGTGGANGLTLRVVDGMAIVTKVEAGSAGEAAGVKPGWTLESAGKLKAQRLIEGVTEAHAESKLLNAYQAMAVSSLLDGGVGEQVSATFRDERNRRRNVTLTLGAPTGTRTVFGNLPPQYVSVESKTLEDNIGYFGLSTFFAPGEVMPKFQDFVETHQNARGVIIDLRGNIGGIGVMANGMSGYLVSESNKELGTMITRAMKLRFFVSPQPTVFTGPVALLVDEMSMSTSEILAGGLRDLQRVRIFGTATPGAALPSHIEKLPSGDRFQFAVANYISAGGAALEGVGVMPDEVVKPDRPTLLAGRDPVIDAAVAWINSQSVVGSVK